MRIAASLFIIASLALSGCAAEGPLVTPADHPASPQAPAVPTAGHSPYHYQLPHDPPELTAPQPMTHGAGEHDGMGQGMDMKPAPGQGQGMQMPPSQGHGQGMSHD